MMTTVVKAFADTNIVLRLFHKLNDHEAVRTLVKSMWDNNTELWISRQVIREYLVQVSNGKNDILLINDQMAVQIGVLQSLFQVADETPEVTAKLAELIAAHPTGGKQVHDANIVATMLAYGIDTMLTLNIADMKRFDPLIKLVSPVSKLM